MRSIRQPARRHSGRYREDIITQLAAPRTIVETATALLPKNDTKSAEAHIVDGGASETPFDNGSTEYRFIAVSADTSNGLRVTYSDDIDAPANWQNEVAVTGFTGAGSARSPILAVEQQAAYGGGAARKAAVKRVFYLNTAVSTDNARLRMITLDDDNNKTGSSDTANSNIILAASGWNKEIVDLCYAHYIANAPNSGSPMQYTIFILAVFYDGSSDYAIGAIYGPSFSNLSVRQVTVNSDIAANSTLGFRAAVPLTSTCGRLRSLAELKGIPVLLSPVSGSEPTKVSLGVSTDGFYTIREVGDAFVGANATPFTTRQRPRSFIYRDGETNPYWVVKETLDTTNEKQYQYSFRGFGDDANDTGEATYA